MEWVGRRVFEGTGRAEEDRDRDGCGEEMEGRIEDVDDNKEKRSRVKYHLVKDLGVPIGREGRELRICERGGSSGERRKGRMRRWRILLAQSPSLGRLPQQPRHPRTEIEKTLNISSSPRSYHTNGHCKSSWGNPLQRLFDPAVKSCRLGNKHKHTLPHSIFQL